MNKKGSNCLLSAGRTEIARNIIKQHCPQYRWVTNFGLTRCSWERHKSACSWRLISLVTNSQWNQWWYTLPLMSSVFATPLEKDFFINILNNRFFKKSCPSMWDTLYMANVNNNNTSGRYNQTTCHNIRWSWPNSFYSCFFQFPDLVQQQGMRRRVRTRWGQAYVDECSRTRNFFGTCSCCSHPLGASPRSLCNSFVSPLPSYRLGAHTHTVRSHIFFLARLSPPSPFLLFSPLHFIYVTLGLCTHGRSWWS
jgi:hypothetical protein